ncbi:hypothetical protein F7725_026880 [Dissostichus mawsoni]|uniref:Uncharacterized protein n=1 Tax=Dissostichus mawsoni TaxID=36200 RepID=A0A7J5X8C1_DISMA|nr:hypothetical protein F7725_026880 [Dissostichus mawsoni]
MWDRQVRLPNCNLEEEKSLKKKGRGSFDIRVEANHNICAVKWYDSRATHEVPTLVRVHLLAHHHPCCDQRLAPLQAGVQSSKDAKAGDPEQETVSGRSSILSHPGEHNSLKTPKRGRPSSGNGSPAPTVTSRSPLNAQKRPSSGDGSPPNGAPSKRSQLPLDVRTQGPNGTFPVKTKRGRCRHCSKGYTNTQCTKCDVRLCFSDNRNCFWDYHCIHI